jgi:hypothetical protein
MKTELLRNKMDFWDEKETRGWEAKSSQICGLKSPTQLAQQILF